MLQHRQPVSSQCQEHLSPGSNDLNDCKHCKVLLKTELSQPKIYCSNEHVETPHLSVISSVSPSPWENH